VPHGSYTSTDNPPVPASPARGFHSPSLSYNVSWMDGRSIPL
jgi:hypothetical protein